MADTPPPTDGQSDKYPPQSGRRRFVKGMVGASALAGAATAGGLAVDATTDQSGVGGGGATYVGINNIDGPAGRPMPLLPIEIDDGALKGVWPAVVEKTKGERTYRVAEEELGGLTYSQRWFQYCGLEVTEGLHPNPDRDPYLRSAGRYDWQSGLDDGAKLRVEQFRDYEEWGNGIGRDGLGKPALATWRSQGDVTTPIQVLVFRTPELPKMIAGEGEYAELSQRVRTFLEAATAEEFMAWVNKCTHLCCNPGYKTIPGSADFGAENQVYCNCHQSVYDPFRPIEKTFVARPRPLG
ncbi:Rieske 2Fe-2S domain-containing protein [Haloarcula pelagica]|uniref:Rieske 2Fe-2S domain-containing protein n=2 Tax=Haloarcula TaxID=2237 RepID=UPI0024C36894|nr:Rieske 2Fe-2S domain-containing protein [Halomicroarcula sp. YJ-61-S]